jgi:hypothetical protein
MFDDVNQADAESRGDEMFMDTFLLIAAISIVAIAAIYLIASIRLERLRRAQPALGERNTGRENNIHREV